MKQDVKEDWVEALRSGEFVQGRGVLDSRGKQCCLGVLAELLDFPWVNKFGRRSYYDENGFAFSTGMLPEPILKASGLTRGDQDTLALMNDSNRATFDEIADYIEAKL